MRISVILLFFFMAFASTLAQNHPYINKAIPDEWIDSVSGRKVIRLTKREGVNESFYFHNNPFIKALDGKSDEMVFTGSTEKGDQYFIVNLKNLNIRQLTSVIPGVRNEIVARKSREVIYQVHDSVFAIHVDNLKTRLLCILPENLHARIISLNADESILAGLYTQGDSALKIRKAYPDKHDFFSRTYDAKIPHVIFTINLFNGEFKKIHEESTWLGHVQFSSVDPNLLMFCHEGPWEKVDRIWVKNIEKDDHRLMHRRTVEREIAGHEFWSWDGKNIWFDLQIPRSVTFNLAGVDYQTGKEVRYVLQRNEWSIHYNISHDQKLFCGDGGDSSQVAKAKDGRWIYLFRPDGNKLKAERLVNMKNHYYKLEPNVHFSPDDKWVIFRSNMFGVTNVFAVEIAKK